MPPEKEDHPAPSGEPPPPPGTGEGAAVVEEDGKLNVVQLPDLAVVERIDSETDRLDSASVDIDSIDTSSRGEISDSFMRHPLSPKEKTDLLKETKLVKRYRRHVERKAVRAEKKFLAARAKREREKEIEQALPFATRLWNRIKPFCLKALTPPLWSLT